jgi:hypothetical protein
MKAKTLIYGVYFALKLWFWKLLTRQKKKKAESESISV